MSDTTTIAIYKSDQKKLMMMLRGGETYRQKIHELVLKEERELKGGDKNGVWKEKTSEEN